ncbi:MAG: FKBP-type peptidyl-prolyl cis-trans isomerase [Candidatus Dadabacteria bacterium]
MKKVLVIAFCFSLALANAQKPAPKKTTPVSHPATTSVSLKTLNDSVSYAIGLSVASFYSQQGITKLNTAALTKAINDVMSKKQASLNEQQANDVIMKYMETAQAEKIKPTIAASEAFLAANKKKPGVKTTATGLQYEVIKEGIGPKPTATDTVVVNYAGTLIDGTEFDNSYKRGTPAEFPANRVIPGWTEALQLMPVGSKYKLYIPYQLGYGTRGAGGSIPGGAALVFEVELLSIKGK